MGVLIAWTGFLDECVLKLTQGHNLAVVGLKPVTKESHTRLCSFNQIMLPNCNLTVFKLPTKILSLEPTNKHSHESISLFHSLGTLRDIKHQPVYGLNLLSVLLLTGNFLNKIIPFGFNSAFHIYEFKRPEKSLESHLHL